MTNKTQTTKRKSRKVKPVFKPYLKGNALSWFAVKRGFRLLGFAAVFMVLNLFLGTVFSFQNSVFLRVAVNLVQVAVYALLLYYDGLSAGDGDVAFAEIQYAHSQAGETIGKAERDRCFHPAKGFVTAFFGVLPLIILCAVYAALARRHTYSLQPLPNWFAAFSAQEELTAPLAYYQRSVPMGLADVLRIIVRVLIYPFYNMVGTRNYDAMLLVDRLSPLLFFIPYLFYGVGYMFGVRSRALTHGGLVQARRRRKKTLPAAVKKKQPARKPHTKELV